MADSGHKFMFHIMTGDSITNTWREETNICEEKSLALHCIADQWILSDFKFDIEN